MNLLDKNVEKEYRENSGFTVVSGIVGLVVAIIVIVAVAIPITDQVITAANLTGTTAVVVAYIPLFLGLVALVLTISFMQ
jgi:competence protein ComGC